MSENPTSDEIDETDDEKLEQDAEQAAGKANTESGGDYGGPGPENETGKAGSEEDGS
ncbi:hypothetical protein [uncultured Arthrobacter sp.]|uniref:hypothetical protein n=1 Tax=uncultured Arthrobacter sp. TaxID=114050 RepID=UPI00261EFF57|nr:hypothetical protein [uncultured Arthrobacter sp.]